MNKEERKKYNLEYYLKNRANNRGRYRDKMKEYYLNNRDKILEQKDKNFLKNYHKILEKRQENYLKNYDKFIEQEIKMKEYRTTNKSFFKW